MPPRMAEQTEEWQALHRFQSTVTEFLKEIEQRFEAAAALRRDFFEKLILLDGGTIALSVTLLGNLASRHATSYRLGLLATSWVLLIVSMAFAMASKWFSHQQAKAVAQIWTALHLIEDVEKLIKAGEQAGDPMNQVKAILLQHEEVKSTAVKDRERSSAITLWCERLSLCFTVTGYSCLVWFAISSLSAFAAAAK